ncbi:RraA family protein [Jiangella muralis]|uniref:RraA family protein n=1 Tax=Jiangella muralis TaxID=702383 RepID=UPI0009F87CDA|nr:hypothetical protein [Jiangella muralis]
MTTRPAGASVVDDDTLAALGDLGSATLFEASGLPIDLPSRLRPVGARRTLAGRALPVQAAEGDNLPLHLALESARAGDVLVVNAAGGDHGYWGEVLTVAAQVRGIRGLVIDGGVRDTDAMAELGFPVFASAVAIRGTSKRDARGAVDEVVLGRTRVHRGDVIVGDADGVVAIPADRAVRVLAGGRARQAAEAGYLERLRAGELTLDIYDLRPTTRSGDDVD